QIRAHLSHVGHPLLGDGKYGINRNERAKGYKFQALYAYRLCFRFCKDGGALDYLNGKSFSLDPKDIWFYRDFVKEGETC
ncbi:MAG: RluA family pseudouridine synthase, partial [Clostridia bacterium]|nr:RluA family pseudouridine synthase [Clostridia bacterium]